MTTNEPLRPFSTFLADDVSVAASYLRYADYLDVDADYAVIIYADSIDLSDSEAMLRYPTSTALMMHLAARSTFVLDDARFISPDRYDDVCNDLGLNDVNP